MKFHSFSLPVAHLLLSGPVPNRPTLVLDHLILPYKSQKVCCDLFLHSFCLFCLFTLICIISVDLSLSPSNLFCYVQSSFIPMGCIVLVTQSCLTLCNPWTIAHQAPLSMGFSRQEYQSGLSFPSPGDLPNPGIKPWSPALQADSLLSEPPGEPHLFIPMNSLFQVLHFFSSRISILFFF